MSKSRKPAGSGKKELSLVRSSAAEYLTFVAASGTGGVEAVYADETIWLTHKMMGVLYEVATHTINYHLKKVFADSELQEDSVIRNFRITSPTAKATTPSTANSPPSSLPATRSTPNARCSSANGPPAS